MGGKSSPAPPDYTGAAEASAASSKEVTEQQNWANRPDQNTPWGSVDWQNQAVWDDATGQYINRWTQNTNLEALPQAALDEQMKLQLERSQLAGGMTDRLWEEYGEGMNWENLPGMADTPQVYTPEQLQTYGVDTGGLQPGGQDVDPSQRYYQDAEDAIYGRSASRLDPQWQRAQEDKTAKLRAQGLRPGDAAYDRAMNELDMAKTDAYQQAQYQATMGAGAEAQRYLGMDVSAGQYDQQRREQQFNEMMQGQGFNNDEIARMWDAEQSRMGTQFNQQMDQAGYQNTLRQQALTEEMQRRGFSLNEINAIMSGQQVGMPEMPGFETARRADSTDYLGAADLGYKGAIQQSSAENAGMNSLMGGASSIASLFAMSDRRLKRDIRRLGTTPGGTPWYSWTYIWGESSQGVMADEAPAEAVHRHSSGYLMVDYARIY